MASPARAYSLLNSLQGMDRIKSASTGYTLSKDIVEEAKKEEEKRRKRESKRGIGRVLGKGLGLLASSLIPGVGIPLQMLMAGAIGGGASQLGQRALGGAKGVSIGKFNRAEDRDTEKYAKDNILSSSIQDALTNALFQGSGGLKKYFHNKDGGEAFSDLSSIKDKFQGAPDINAIEQAATRSGPMGNPYSTLIEKNLNPGVIPRKDFMPFMGLEKPLWTPQGSKVRSNKNTFGMLDFLNQFMKDGEYGL